MKLVRGGVLNEDFIGLLRVEFAHGGGGHRGSQGDVGALETANRRVQELVVKQGVERLLAAQRDLIDYSAQKARDVLRKIPDGDYEFWDLLDDDMISGIPIRVRL